MKKIFAAVMMVIVLIALCPVAFAADNDDKLDTLKKEIDERIVNSLDSDIEEELESKGVTPSDTSGITGLDIKGFFSDLFEKFRESMKRPIVIFGRILAVSLLCSAVNILCTDNDSLNRAFSTMCVICVITVISEALSATLEELQASINSVNTFMIAYIPIFSAVTAAGGQAASAGVYSSSTLLICEAAEFIASKLLVPLMSVVTAITLVSSLDPKLKISGVSAAIRKLTTWLLATLMLVFMGVLSIQGVAGSAADSLVSKTLRFTASSFIPVIGGSVSDAFVAVKSGMGVIKAAVGGFGMLAVFLLAVRPFLLIISMRITLWAGRIANELLGLQQTSELLKNLDSVLSIGVSILITITAAFLIATAAVLSLMGTGA